MAPTRLKVNRRLVLSPCLQVKTMRLTMTDGEMAEWFNAHAWKM